MADQDKSKDKSKGISKNLSSEERRKKNIIRKYANSDVEMPIALQKFIRGNTSTPPTPPASKSKEIKLDYQQPLPRDYPKKLKGGGMAKGGRVNFKGGGCTTKGMNKKAYGKNS